MYNLNRQPMVLTRIPFSSENEKVGASLIKGVIFDFDGVILNTETIEFKVFEDLFYEYGIKLPLEMWERRIGGNKNNFDPYDYLIEYTQCKIDKIEL
ncbi:HAD hydrolase-like protein, partial [Paenibacillus sp. GCM10012303]|uniref:HAD hydrolase-like protein n=1 Tax=Paenibacillus sp. GCM10012303 TaxID=3317340 RepID=UPI00361F9C9F